MPAEHGAWVFLLSPLLIGLFAAGGWTSASGYLIVGALAAFLARQPLTVAVKAYSGRRSRQDLPAARFWILVYSLIGLLALAGLVSQGAAFVLILAAPGVLVFLWHLYLVSQRSERHQVGVDVVASGTLALAAPAAYWVGVGRPDPLGWWLWGLTWLQSAGSIVYAFLRLGQRKLDATPPLGERLRMARRALLYNTFNLATVSGLSLAGIAPPLLFLPYLLQWGEVLWGALRPAVGLKPTTIGLRQLAVSTLFTALFILVWRL